MLSFGSAIALFALSSKQNKEQNISEVYKERINKFYAPFYKTCIIGMNKYIRPSELPSEIANRYFNLITDNITYMGTKSQELYPKYLSAYLKCYFPAQDCNLKEKSIFREEYDKVFKDMAKLLLSEYTHLCKELKLEAPVKLF